MLVTQGMNVVKDKRGFSQVEIMISLVLLLFVFLALAQTALVGIDSNMTNILRDEAVSIAEMRMNEARSLAFTETVDNLVSDTGSLSGADCPAGFPATGVLVEKDMRSISGLDFCTNRTVNTLNSETKEVNIRVGWKWKGENYNHSISTIVRRS